MTAGGRPGRKRNQASAARPAATKATGQRKARGPYAKSAARREEIIQAAIDHISRHGYQGTSLRAIAADVGVTPAAVLHHFDSKEALLTQVLLEYRRWQQERLTALMLDRSGREALIEGLARDYSSPGRLMRLWIILAAEATNPDHPAAAYIADRFEEARTLLRATLTFMKEARDLRPEADVDQLAVVLLSLAHGLHIQHLLEPELDAVGVFTTFLDQHVMAPTPAPARRITARRTSPSK
jgi:AcrR family transcriptional regulator